MNWVADCFSYVGQVKLKGASVRYSVECYHMETRTRTETRGNQTVEITEEVRVVTWSGGENWYCGRWIDVSGHVTSELMNFQTCKVRYHTKIFFGDSETRMDYENKRNQFFSANKSRDKYMDTFENQSIDGGVKPMELSLVNLVDTPAMLGVWWYLFFSFVIPASAFYRIWLERMSVRTDFTFRKVLFLQKLTREAELKVSEFRKKTRSNPELIRALGSGLIHHFEEVAEQDRFWKNTDA
jgi:hypothetical protein